MWRIRWGLRRCSSGDPGAPLMPMINMVFLLLIFFMVAGGLERVDPLPVNAPRLDLGERRGADPAELFIGARGEIVFQEQNVSYAELQRRLQAVVIKRDSMPLVVKVDADAEAAILLELLEILKATGFREVDLVVEGAGA